MDFQELKPGLSGFIPIRNGDSLDYCWRESVLSLLPICDEIILCDSESNDGTRESMDRLSSQESKIRVINWPWPKFATHEDWLADRKDRPDGDPRMLIRWLNFARNHCKFNTQISIDADEVICPKGYAEIKRAVQDRIPRFFNRINFWGDARHEAPHGTVCGEKVAKLGPTEYETVSDEPRPEGEPPMRSLAVHNETLRIFHLGFLRRPEAFFAKSKVVQAALHSTYDPRLIEAEKTGKAWTDLSPFDRPMLNYPYNDFPDYVRVWLEQRGRL